MSAMIMQWLTSSRLSLESVDIIGIDAEHPPFLAALLGRSVRNLALGLQFDADRKSFSMDPNREEY
jgi:hypothetical protein